MITEIEIEGLGTYRLPNMHQDWRIKNMPAGLNKHLAPLAFGLGMTIQQFKKLSPENREEVRQAFWQLVSPSNVSLPDQPATTSSPGLPRAWERLTEARMVELGRELLAIKAKLPHGHFGPWVKDKSGISYTAAQRFMRAAKEADEPERSAA
jgi:hypothetical protein